MRKAIVVAAMFLAGCSFFTDEPEPIPPHELHDSRANAERILDARIREGILDRMAKTAPKSMVEVTVDVWERRVMLTGIAADKKTGLEIGRLAAEDDAVLRVYNELRLASGRDPAKDAFVIESAIASALMETGKINRANFRWRALGDRVWIIGRARDEEELDALLALVRAVPGVGNITHFISATP